jgi:periplasmic mercuric ion binding protein
MKKFLLVATIFCALLISVRAADSTVTLSNVHLCCGKCVKGVDSAVSHVSGANAVCDKEASTVTLTAADKATLQKAVNALTSAGYFGESSDASIKVPAKTGAKAAKVQSLKVSGVHLCCSKCVKVVNAAVSKVPGVTGNTASKDSATFEVTGDFSPKDVFAALNKAGLTGKVAK